MDAKPFSPEPLWGNTVVPTCGHVGDIQTCDLRCLRGQPFRPFRSSFLSRKERRKSATFWRSFLSDK